MTAPVRRATRARVPAVLLVPALLGRLLIADTGHLALLRTLGGEPVADTGLRASMRVETAGEWIDAYLRTP